MTMHNVADGLLCGPLLVHFLVADKVVADPLGADRGHGIVIMQIEEVLISVVFLMEMMLEFLSVLCVAIGVVKAIQLAFKVARRRQRQVFPFLDVRLQFGVWLALALEFQLGADILATTVTPTFITLGKLGAIALIRTFLNFFLNKELVEEYHLKKNVEQSDSPDVRRA